MRAMRSTAPPGIRPSPETGHVGWCWWAMGSMGDAPSYEAARDAAVAEIQRRMDRRMAVL